jgi:hypothetical protein
MCRSVFPPVRYFCTLGASIILQSDTRHEFSSRTIEEACFTWDELRLWLVSAAQANSELKGAFPSVYKEHVKLSLETFFLLLPFVLGLLSCVPSYESHRQSVGLLGWVISLVARPLPTHTKVTQTDIRASSGIRTHDPVFERANAFDALDQRSSTWGTRRHLRGYAKTSCINQDETQEALGP